MAKPPPSTRRASSSRGDFYVGTAGWALPRAHQAAFAGDGAHLVRYASMFDAVEINSTFRRTHRPATLERWAASVPARFRFSVKLPQAITHGARLADTEHLLDVFLSEMAPLGSALGCMLVQLPPSLAFDETTACRFLTALRKRYDGPVAMEPRHADLVRGKARWPAARACASRAWPPILPRAPGDSVPGGFDGFAYHRLHGAPRIYYSAYDEPFLDRARATARAPPSTAAFPPGASSTTRHSVRRRATRSAFAHACSNLRASVGRRARRDSRRLRLDIGTSRTGRRHIVVGTTSSDRSTR